jgi:hypothetical protein
VNAALAFSFSCGVPDALAFVSAFCFESWSATAFLNSSDFSSLLTPSALAFSTAAAASAARFRADSAARSAAATPAGAVAGRVAGREAGFAARTVAGGAAAAVAIRIKTVNASRFITSPCLYLGKRASRTCSRYL